jgi:selenocysteine-specific translation elongation factor
MNYIISVPLNETLASFIGKKGSENSIVFYNRKVDDNVIVALAPSSNEDKFYYGMAESMLLSSQIVISTQSVDKQLGEVLIAASLLDKHTIITNENDIKNLLAGNILKDFEISSREELLDKILKHRHVKEGGATRIDIDHGFSVKGVGTVALGIVLSGTVKVHDALFHSSGKQVTVKSIQSQDVDIESAGVNTRVGLSLKGVEAADISKGDIIYTKSVAPTKRITVKMRKSNLVNETIAEGGRYMFVSNFSYSNVKVENAGETAVLSLERPITLMDGDKFLLIREKSPRIFASGVVEKTA